LYLLTITGCKGGRAVHLFCDRCLGTLVIRANGWAYITRFWVSQPGTLYQHRQSPWGPWYYLSSGAASFAPGQIYLPVAIARLQFWQRAHWRSNDRSTQLGLFACSGLWVFLAFHIAAKLPSYVLPLMPAAAILVALHGRGQVKAKAKGKIFFL